MTGRLPAGALLAADRQSALSAAGVDASEVLILTWILFIGGTIVLLWVLATTALAIAGPRRVREKIATSRFVTAAGIGVPVVVLTALLFSGFAIMRPADGKGFSDEPLKVAVTGYQWWWRVAYEDPAGEAIESANELRIPVGRPVELSLTSADVIHSFWVPAYAGKLDMVPGRVNTLRLTATKAGVVRGQCAEYCGGPHALMGLFVVATSQPEFDAWWQAEQQPAKQAGSAGERLFLSSGCGACHAVRGTAATGRIGPDLTHVASRLSIGAAVLPTGKDAFARWIREHHRLKPGNRMPVFGILDGAEVSAIADYLAQLE